LTSKNILARRRTYSQKYMRKKQNIQSTCSGGLVRAGETDILATTPEPESISLRIPLMPSKRSVLAPNGDPLAHVDRRRIKP